MRDVEIMIDTITKTELKEEEPLFSFSFVKKITPNIIYLHKFHIISLYLDVYFSSETIYD